MSMTAVIDEMTWKRRCYDYAEIERKMAFKNYLARSHKSLEEAIYHYWSSGK